MDLEEELETPLFERRPAASASRLRVSYSCTTSANKPPIWTVSAPKSRI